LLNTYDYDADPESGGGGSTILFPLSGCTGFSISYVKFGLDKSIPPFNEL